MFRMATMLIALWAMAAIGFDDAQSQDNASGRRSLCVISAIGESFALKKIGVTVFENEASEVSIEAWALDNLVVSKISGLLGQRFVVRNIPAPRSAFENLERAGLDLFGLSDGEFGSRVRKITATSQACDLYLVVSNTVSKFGSTNQFVRGLGLVKASGLFGMSTTFLHALTVVTVLDGRTFATLRNERASIGQPTFMATIVGPHREVPESAWPASGDLSANEPLRRATWALVEQSLDKTVPELTGAN